MAERSIHADAIYNFRSLVLNSCSTGRLEGKMPAKQQDIAGRSRFPGRTS
jgi:hypothetical protein